MAGEEAEPDLDIGVVGDNTELDIWQYDNQIQERTSLLTQKSKSGDIPNFNSSGYRNELMNHWDGEDTDDERGGQSRSQSRTVS